MSKWAIVLAGGEGERLKPFVQSWFGYPYPKQFCTFCGTRSMLEHTLYRTARVVGNQIVTVVDSTHTPFLPNELPGTIIEQPQNKGTAAGVFLAASYIRAQDEDAQVVVMPSDHFIYPEDRFVEHVQTIFQKLELFPDYLILAAAGAHWANSDYGWIEPGGAWKDKQTREVKRFYEKPSSTEAAELYRRGSYWSTMIVSARLETLWRIGSWSAPLLIHRFNELVDTLLTPETNALRPRSERALLSLLYRGIPTTDFSSEILAGAARQTLVYPLSGVYWSDWGQPERILQTLDEFGLSPNFSAGSNLLPDKPEPPGEGFSYKIGARVRDLMSHQEGTVRDRWLTSELNYIGDLFSSEEEMYEIVTDTGEVFADSGDNLVPAPAFRGSDNRKEKQGSI